MKNKEELDRECNQRLAEYLEVLTKHRELLSQFYLTYWGEPSRPIPKRGLDEAAYKKIRESEQEVEDACKKWDEAVARFLKDRR